jgi:5-methyltetrahydropteroyltriglutamate--homocysteine methyltransferase
MRRSVDHILTSHVGSLPRPDALIEANRARQAGETTGEAAFQQTLRTAVSDVVGHQRKLDVDIPNDGEFGKSVTDRVHYGDAGRKLAIAVADKVIARAKQDGVR